MTHIYFVRHAQKDLTNHDDATRSLTEKGHRDAALVTAYLADKTIDAVYSSPYCRAVDTIRPFAEKYGHTIRMDAEFREREINVWFEDFLSFAEKQWQDFDYKTETGESLNMVSRRIAGALDRILEAEAGRNVVIGGHGTAICMAIRRYRPNFGFEDFMQMREKMPWIVHMAFDGKNCRKIEYVDLLIEG